MRRGLIGCFLTFMLVALVEAHADERRRGDARQDAPFSSEHWDGWKKWTPDRRTRRRGLPDDFTIDKPGKCEVRCVRSGRSYRCKEYRC
jgi:Ni/Co efflux regulator RcnB